MDIYNINNMLIHGVIIIVGYNNVFTVEINANHNKKY